jgi:hypothetical protein
MRRRTKVALCVLVALPFTFHVYARTCYAWLRHNYESIRTYREFAERIGPPTSIFVVTREGDGEECLRMIPTVDRRSVPSEPLIYVFRRDGSRADWTFDSGTYSGFIKRWTLPDLNAPLTVAEAEAWFAQR